MRRPPREGVSDFRTVFRGTLARDADARRACRAARCANARADERVPITLHDALAAVPDGTRVAHRSARDCAAEAAIAAAKAWPAPSVHVAHNTLTARATIGASIPLPRVRNRRRGAAVTPRRRCRSCAPRPMSRCASCGTRVVQAWIAARARRWRRDGGRDRRAASGRARGDREGAVGGGRRCGCRRDGRAGAARARADVAVARGGARRGCGVGGARGIARLGSAAAAARERPARHRADCREARDAAGAARRSIPSACSCSIGSRRRTQTSTRRAPRAGRSLALDGEVLVDDPTNEHKTDVMVGVSLELPLFAHVGDRTRVARALEDAERARLAVTDDRARRAGSSRRTARGRRRPSGCKRSSATCCPRRSARRRSSATAYREGARDLAFALQAERDLAAVRAERNRRARRCRGRVCRAADRGGWRGRSVSQTRRCSCCSRRLPARGRGRRRRQAGGRGGDVPAGVGGRDRRVVEVSGVIAPPPKLDAVVSSPVAGRVAQVAVEEGDHVAAGALLAIDRGSGAAGGLARGEGGRRVGAGGEDGGRARRRAPGAARRDRHRCAQGSRRRTRASSPPRTPSSMRRSARSGLATSNIARRELRAPRAGIVLHVWKQGRRERRRHGRDAGRRGRGSPRARAARAGLADRARAACARACRRPCTCSASRQPIDASVVRVAPAVDSTTLLGLVRARAREGATASRSARRRPRRSSIEQAAGRARAGDARCGGRSSARTRSSCARGGVAQVRTVKVGARGDKASRSSTVSKPASASSSITRSASRMASRSSSSEARRSELVRWLRRHASLVWIAALALAALGARVDLRAAERHLSRDAVPARRRRRERRPAVAGSRRGADHAAARGGARDRARRAPRAREDDPRRGRAVAAAHRRRESADRAARVSGRGRSRRAAEGHDDGRRARAADRRAGDHVQRDGAAKGTQTDPRRLREVAERIVRPAFVRVQRRRRRRGHGRARARDRDPDPARRARRAAHHARAARAEARGAGSGDRRGPRVRPAPDAAGRARRAGARSRAARALPIANGPDRADPARRRSPTSSMAPRIPT